MNCRRVLRGGLDTLIELVEAAAGPGDASERAGGTEAAGGSSEQKGGAAAGDAAAGGQKEELSAEEQVRADMAAVGERPKPWKQSTATNHALALELLQLVGPYNYVLCTNCGTRQDGGTTCAQCAHPIDFAQW
jgi:hypothetical protein